MLTIFTDGACQPNPGRGGWAWVRVEADGTVREDCGGDPATTNNRMELRAAIEALNALAEPTIIRLFSDSRYVIDGMTKWMANWKRRSWLTRTNEPVRNADLWIALDAAAARHHVEWRWVRGHSGDPHNERADWLAMSIACGYEKSSVGPQIEKSNASAGSVPVVRRIAPRPAVMPFGKFRGQPLSDVPLDYLRWLASVELREPLRRNVRAELARRQEASRTVAETVAEVAAIDPGLSAQKALEIFRQRYPDADASAFPLASLPDDRFGTVQ